MGVNNYAEAAAVAKTLVEQGNVAIELCAGFGDEGVAMVKKAVGNRAAVGAVRFDNHPGLEFKSGDEIFSSSNIGKGIQGGRGVRIPV